MMAKKTSVVLIAFGWIILISDIPYLYFGAVCMHSFFKEDCGIVMAWCFNFGFPTFIVGFYKLRIGLAFLKKKYRNLKWMLILIGIIDGLFGYFIQEFVSKSNFTAYWAAFYLLPFIFLAQSNVKEQFK